MKPVTVRTLKDMKSKGSPITMLTCYDATFARLLDEAGVDTILVGDSLGMVIKGEDNTLNVSVEEIAYHVSAVARGTQRAHIVGDMPFLSYQASKVDAVKNAGRLLQAGAHSVKLEGGVSIAPTIAALVEAGIPVVGHVGLMPQSVHAQGGFVVQGRDEASAQRIMDDALAVQEAGAFAIVLEGVPVKVAEAITDRLEIPTIGIGAGAACDGQVLVLYDILGLNPDFKPKFVKHYADGAEWVRRACTDFVDEVQTRAFPTAKHSFGAKPARRQAPAEDATPYAAPLQRADPHAAARLNSDARLRDGIRHDDEYLAAVDGHLPN